MKKYNCAHCSDTKKVRVGSPYCDDAVTDCPSCVLGIKIKDKASTPATSRTQITPVVTALLHKLDSMDFPYSIKRDVDMEQPSHFLYTAEIGSIYWGQSGSLDDALSAALQQAEGNLKNYE